MKIVFDQSFYKWLKKIKDKVILSKVKQIILQAESAENIGQLPNVKKLVGHKSFYRIRIGDYRIGMEMEQDIIRFIIIAHRKDIISYSLNQEFPSPKF